MKIEIVSLGLILFSSLIIILGIVKVHTYPGKVAAERKHPQKDAIDATSLMGLLIFPFWMFALIWAYSGAVLGSLYVPSGGEDGASKDTVPAKTPKET